jgi:squalene-hopene/tetraprenyl-beta-curcumene cyclase
MTFSPLRRLVEVAQPEVAPRIGDSTAVADGRLAGESDELSARISLTLEAAQSYLLSIQKDDGHWCGELEGDSIVESEYIMALQFLGRGQGTRTRKLAEYIRTQQLPSGGWAVYPGGPAEVSASVKAYFVLKLTGDTPDAPHMVKAREVILGLGGIEACNSFTKIYLSIFGQCDWEDCPAVPPELILLPDWFPLNIYRISSWSRAIVVPLSIIWARKPVCPVPEHARIRELRCGRPLQKARPELKRRLWTAVFRGLDLALKGIDRASLTPFRRKALGKAEAWILERLEESDGLGAILPPIINTVIAFRCLGYSLEDPRLEEQLRHLEKLEIEEGETVRIQPCFSACWDTAMTLQALRECGLSKDDPALLKAAEWILEKEVRRSGDWKHSNPDAEPAGWFFEYRNEFYPDTDDTAAVLTALSRVRFPDRGEDEKRRAAVARGLRWQLSMQNPDGGWGAFDKGCDNEIFTLIPFADHNAMIDPSCEDITGRALEAFHRLGLEASHPALSRAVAFLRARQGDDGTWYGRWGCNYIYGTWLAVSALERVGEVLSTEGYQRAAVWLHRHQNEDGGWGELPRSYDEPKAKGLGPSTASQTAWALMALIALGHADSGGVRRGLEYLLRTQRDDGSWEEDYWTGTGFPKVFYLRYHLYASYFPPMALAQYRRAGAEASPLRTLEQVEA